MRRTAPEACSSPCTLILLILPTNCFPLDRFFSLEWSFLLLHVSWSREFPYSEWIQTRLQQPQEHTSLHMFLHISAYGAQLQVTSLAWGDCLFHTYLEMLFWFCCPIVLNKFLLEEATSWPYLVTRQSYLASEGFFRHDCSVSPTLKQCNVIVTLEPELTF